MSDTLIDVRSVPPQLRHPLIFSTFDALPVGEGFEIVNNHDPFPLRDQFQRARPQQFDWRYLREGPAQWHVRISRVAQPSGEPVALPGGCACGGGSGGGSGHCGS